ncbi:uncharacterized protein LOC113315270 isoform X2 [Papaver somniferum]|uniref:uncharacterized protein LOC113315270 isoform X2 n=1 Tax=Papaver somniferum TaxID=3469 RepID=UPI000E6F9642|nr:uncharacterized protein LOC113315270 isoform X2 [Papaver somniferum]
MDETLRLCSKLIIDSQDAMLGRIEAMLCKLVESQVHKFQSVSVVLSPAASTDSALLAPPEEGVSGNRADELPANTSNTSSLSLEEIVEIHDQDGQEQPTTVMEVKSAANGDWETAREFLNLYPAALTEPITVYGETALHIAAYESQVTFVQEIVNVMPEESLALQGNRRGFTALHIAAKVGDVRTAALMVRRNRNLTQIRDKKGRVPLQIAAKHASDGQKEVLEYLISETRDEDPSPFSGHGGAGLLRNILYANFYDMALSLVQRFPKLVTEKTKITQSCGLEVMIQRPFVFLSGAQLAWWQRCIYYLIQVDMGSTFNHGTTGDEENLLGSSSTPSRSSGRTITKFISTYLMPYLTRVPRIKKLYSQKLMHREALFV